MKSRKYAIVLLFAIFSILASPFARAADIPLLSWERGKQQNIVLGGSSTNAGWKIFLVAPGQPDRVFTSSLPNKAGYVVYSVELPNDLPLGGYSIEARAKGATTSTVAGVNVIARAYYTISSIPTDLRLLFTLYALIISTFSIVRSRKYAHLSFVRDKSHSRAKNEEPGTSKVPSFLQPFYKFRSRRQDEMEISFLKFISLKDGETLHKYSPTTWAVLPFFTFISGIYMSYSIQAKTVVPNVALPFIIAIAVIGAIDAVSGATAATGFIFASFILGDINGMRSFLEIAGFVLAWCAPSLLATMYLFILRIDFAHFLKTLPARIREYLAIVLSALVGSALVIVSAIVTDSLAIEIQGKSFLRWPLAGIVAVVIVIKNFMDISIDKHRVKKEIEVETFEEAIELNRVMSSQVTSVLAIAIFGITYVWTQKAPQSLLATAIISAPFFLSNVSVPRLIGKRLKLISRNVLVEIFTISVLTIVVYQGIQHLPMSTREKAQAFILVGLVPVLLHSIYSAGQATAERIVSEKEEVEQ